MKLVNLMPLKEELEQTPLEVIAHDDNQIYYIDPRDIETYIHGKMVVAMEKLGSPSKELTRDNSDATPGQTEYESAKSALTSPTYSNQDPMEEDIDEGTCGYSIDGEGGDEPAGPHLLKKSNLQETLQIRAGIIK